jgi:peptide methionine sulfoxide reductase msrA/msrB
MVHPQLALALLSTVLYAEPAARPTRSDMEHKPLTPAEAQVIVNKGTEPPGSGRFLHHDEDGRYACKRCGAALFDARAKFDSGCGWPSFDQALPEAVREAPDADGRRSEILCAACGAHLGHVFRGEGHTPKNTRHCVNSISLSFDAAYAASESEDAAYAYFAGGCFWGVEHHIARASGVREVTSGYMGGHEDEPSYGEVCTGMTGHAEAVEVVYDPGRTSYEALARLFFEIHDPTQIDRQGPDMGPQYRSAVFVSSERERQVIQRLVAELRRRGLDVATRVEDAARFWPAEDDHQDYYERTGKAPYCHSRVKRFGD